MINVKKVIQKMYHSFNNSHRITCICPTLTNNNYKLAAIIFFNNGNRVTALYDECNNWIILSFNPKLILTEKMSAMINEYNQNRDYDIHLYNITKFLLLKQLVEKYLVVDLLQVIVDLSD